MGEFDNPDILAAYNPTHSQAGVHNAVNTNNNTDDKGSVCDPSTSTSTSSKTSASFVTSSLTNRASLSDKSTVDLVGTTDYNLETHSPDVDLVPTLAHLSSGNGSPAVNLNLPPSQAGVQYDVNINNNTDDEDSFCDPSTSTTTSPKTSASFVTSSLTNRVSLLSLSDKSTVGMAGNTDYATGSFCSSCSIKPTLLRRFWLDGTGCAMCSYDNGG